VARISKARLAERRAEEWDLYVRGKTQTEIGRMFGLDNSTVSDDLRIHAESLGSQGRDMAVKRHEETIAWAVDQLRELATMEGAPVTAGKDGQVVYDPETGAVVRDYAGRYTAIRELRGYLDREAKLLGLNAADKVEVSGAVTVEGSVDAEIRKLSEQLGIQDPAVLPASGSPAGLSEGVGSDALTE
jgi:hypothetical protein